MNLSEATPKPVIQLGPRGQLVLLLVSGLMLGLSYPRPNVWLLAYIGLAPMTVAALRARSYRSVGLISWLAGWAWWLVMIRWMSAVTGPGYVALSAFMGVYWTGYVLALRLIDQRLGWPRVFSVPLVWVGFEYLRGIFLSGFPWFNLGHSQPAVMIQIADVTGSYGVSFLVAMVNGAIVDLLTRPLINPMTQRWTSVVRLSATAALAGLIVTLAYGAWRMNQPVDGDVIRVALVQTNVPQSNKVFPTDEQDLKNFQRMMTLTQQSLVGEPDLIVWPETMVPRALNDESLAMFRRLAAPYLKFHDDLVNFAQEHEVAMLVGAHAMEGWPAFDPARASYHPTHRFNAAYLVDPTGRIADRYDKIHRVPFGEYIPWVESIPPLKKLLLNLTPYKTDYTLRAGERFTRFTVTTKDHAWRLSAPICFEDVVSDVPRKMVWADGAKQLDLLVNLSNDGWFAGTAQCLQQEQIARFRCVENRVPMARAVNTGVSGWIDSTGRLLGNVTVDGLTQDVDGQATGTLHRDTRTTLFSRIGDWPGVICLIVTAGLTVGLFAQKLWHRKPS